MLRVPFVLASGSPRRRQLLSDVGFSFEVQVSDIDETIPASLHEPSDIVEYLAAQKAEAVAPHVPEALTLGADTVVVHDGVLLGKPVDAIDARAMLRRLSGATHTVFTGLALLHPSSNRRATTHEATRVRFADLTDEEIARYVASGSPMDKAGGYGIQGDLAAMFISGIEGDFFNVVGLPLHRFYQTLKEHFGDLLIG